MRAFSSGNSCERRGDGLQRQRQQPLQVDVGEVALLDPGDRRDLAVRARQVLEHRAASRRGSARAGLRLGGAAAAGAVPRTSSSVIRPCGPVPVDRREVDAELLRRAAGRAASRGPSLALSRSARWLGPRFAAAPASAAAPSPPITTSTRADRDDVALGDEDLRHDAGRGRRDLDRRLVGLRSRRAGRPPRSPGPPATSQRAISPSVRPSPRSGSLNS